MNSTQPQPIAISEKEISNILPEVKDLLKAGVQFGHEKKRWNPKMQRYIYGVKNDIHIINIALTQENLKKAMEIIANLATKGEVVFVGTKRQAAEIVKEEAIRAGAHFINIRWAGGLLTNFAMVRRSFYRLRDLEKMFEEGVENRTKFEVSRMKKEWQKLDRLYSGIKTLDTKPVAMVIVDAKYEKSAIREGRAMRIPLIGVIDTNTDPDIVDYVIPSNDDALGSIGIITKALADAVLLGNKGNGVKHQLKDYSKVEVKITKSSEAKLDVEVVKIENTDETADTSSQSKAKYDSKPRPAGRKVLGILEKVQKQEPVAEEKKSAKKPAVKDKTAKVAKSAKKAK